jgi:hypothetical protein
MNVTLALPTSGTPGTRVLPILRLRLARAREQVSLLRVVARRKRQRDVVAVDDALFTVH